ncbi:MAG: acyltransferase [Candidatus Eisenbacteria bacterium]|uniref:Acyltransferase n=1 Tax=Eiseniibacteriota bacterium TaxID=2212470 RepID=A0A849SS59_UNCEI|nr:acyltransferase [Candidatus Eisenbacteria bacterium]
MIYLELLRIFIRRKLFMLMPMSVRLRWLREDGVKIGSNCIVHTPYFSVEPYLIELGDRVLVSAGTEFITHDAAGHLFPEVQDFGLYGRIVVGSNTFFGIKCLVLPGARIGANCVIGSGAVVRGVIPEGSVVMGNPAEVVMKTEMLKALMLHSKGRMATAHLSIKEKREALCKHFGIA